MGLFVEVVDQLMVKRHPHPSLLVQDWGARRRLEALRKESRRVVVGVHGDQHRKVVESE